MKKRYIKIKKSQKESIRGAYDLKGKWWFEEDIETFTGGIINLCFGKHREHIKIIEKWK